MEGKSARTIIITGGAGYLGRCTAELLRREGLFPVLMDNFSTGRRAMVGELPCIDVDLTDKRATLEAFNKTGGASGVIHFAARALVSESCERPEEYFRNNVLSALHVAEGALATRIPAVVHSSSCAVYGLPRSIPIAEDSPCEPVSPYGESKWMVERMLNQFARHKGLGVVHLRYFNPAGSFAEASLGEAHEPETHLIPNVVGAFLSGRPVPVYGTDYPTPDGTCHRDFVHVEDLAFAHWLALKKLAEGVVLPAAINLGGGKGVSVREVIRAAGEVLGSPLPEQPMPRRPGDPPALVADTSLAKKALGWAPRKGVREMIRDHAQWITGKGKLLRK